MTDLKATVVIPTRDRLDSLVETVSCLCRQTLPPTDYEIVIVDDGSDPAVFLTEAPAGPKLSVIRAGDAERSAARNAGASAARGALLVFVDDDMTLGPDFLSRHLAAHSRWPGALVVGSIVLPPEAMDRPFVRFRQALELYGLPESEGPTDIPNFCTAANMSIAQDAFRAIGGFDPRIVSSEDQDLAFRHRARGGIIVSLQEAVAIHRDKSLNIRAYCRRVEWGSRNSIPFCSRYPEWRDNIERESVNGPLRIGEEPPPASLRKLAKSVASVWPCRAGLFLVAGSLERAAPNSAALDLAYRWLIGIHIFRGYRQGLAASAPPGAGSQASTAAAPGTEI